MLTNKRWIWRVWDFSLMNSCNEHVTMLNDTESENVDTVWFIGGQGQSQEHNECVWILIAHCKLSLIDNTTSPPPGLQV
jgi:hypothetical protein